MSSPALSFDGTDYVETTAPADFGTGSFSIGGWIYLHTLDDVRSTLAATYDGTSGNTSTYTGFILGVFKGQWRVWTTGNNVVFAGTPDTGVWQHLFGQRFVDGTLELYLDGELIGTGTSTTDVSSPPAVFIGAEPDLRFGLDGMVDDVRLYPYPLTQGAIRDVMGGTVRGDELALWAMDEGSGSVVSDASGNNHDGTIHGAVWSSRATITAPTTGAATATGRARAETVTRAKTRGGATATTHADATGAGHSSGIGSAGATGTAHAATTGRAAAHGTATGGASASATGVRTTTARGMAAATGDASARGTGRVMTTGSASARATVQATASGLVETTAGSAEAAADASAAAFTRGSGTGRATAVGDAVPMVSGVRVHTTTTTEARGVSDVWTAGRPTFAAQEPRLVGSITTRRVGERDRIEEYVKTPFKTPLTPEGNYAHTDYGALLAMLGEFFEGVATIRNEVLRSRYVNFAYGNSLDEIGALVFVPRHGGEADEHYRPRIKAAVQRYMGGATLDEITETIADVLRCDPDDIGVFEPAAVESARIDLEIPERALDGSVFSTAALIEFIYLFRAGGVEIYLSLGANFRHRSIEDYWQGISDVSHSYNVAPYRGRVSNPNER